MLRKKAARSTRRQASWLLECLEDRSMLSTSYLAYDSPDGHPTRLTTIGNDLYFEQYTPQYGGEVWVMRNGTAPSTRLTDINHGQGNSFDAISPDSFAVVNGILYFTAADGFLSSQGMYGRELWRLDPTSRDGATLVADLYPGSTGGVLNSSEPEHLIDAGDVLYFTAIDQTKTRQLFRYTGSGAPQVVLDWPAAEAIGLNGSLYYVEQTRGTLKFCPTTGAAVSVSGLAGVSAIANLRIYDGQLYFTASDATNGGQLWRANGSVAERVTSLNGPNGLIDTAQTKTNLIDCNGTLYFGGTGDAISGEELWTYDPVNGAQQIANINADVGGPQNSSPRNFTVFKNRIYFSAVTATEGRELFSTAGPGTGAQLQLDLYPGPGSGIVSTSFHGVVVGDTLYFSGTDAYVAPKLWSTDGTIAQPLATLTNYTYESVVLGDRLYYLNLSDLYAAQAAPASPALAVFGATASPIFDGDVTPALGDGTDFGTAVPGSTGVVRRFAVYNTGSADLTLSNLIVPAGFTIVEELMTVLAPGTGDYFSIRMDAAGSGVKAGEVGFTTNVAASIDFNFRIQGLHNTAPNLIAAKNAPLRIVEDVGTPSGKVGTLVDGLVHRVGSLKNVSDPDVGASTGIAIVGADMSRGAWFYSLNDGTSWTALGGVGVTGARLLAADGRTRLYFRPKADYHGTVDGALAFRAWDRSSGANGGFVTTYLNGGATPFSATIDALSVIVSPVNDAPTLDFARSPTLKSVMRNTAMPVGAVGTLVSAIVSLTSTTKNVADADAGAVTGIAVTKVDVSNGTWFYSTNNGGTWLALSASTSVAKLLAADASTRIYFRPKAGFSGSVAQAITFRAWDRTSGANGGTANVTNSGGTTAFSKLGDTASIVVT
jgi:ELWxxDGT repeat protein